MKSSIVVFLILLSAFFFFTTAVLFLARKPEKIVETQIDTVTVTKTFQKYIKGDKIPFKILDTIYHVKKDTAFIIKEFNTVKAYQDTIRQDSNLFVIQDTISQNKIIGRSFQAKIQEKTIVATNTITPSPKASVYLGIRADLSKDYTKVNQNIILNIKTRQKGLFSIGYGMSGYSIGYSLKL